MRLLSEQIEILKKQGYRQATAEAKAAHDAILLAMSRCGLKASSTVKGGVVMSHVTNDIRRTTMDMDIAFIHRSISEVSVRRFITRLNCLPGVKISIFGTVGELLHDDYRGKRVYLHVNDGSLDAPLMTKLDIGVHTHSEISQVECCFVLGDETDKVDLQANSMEQIFAEKLLSLLKLRALSKRPKDIFDLYYLREHVRAETLKRYLDILVYGNRSCKCNEKAEAVAILRETFASKSFMRRLSGARVNWLEIDPQLAVDGIVRFVESL